MKIENIAEFKQPIKLTSHQESAFNSLVEFILGEEDSRMMSLIGYAGTGKTTLISKLIDRIREENNRYFRIAIAAPTNKAVGVLKEKISSQSSIEFGSVHSFLGLRMTEKDSGEQVCQKEGDSKLHEYSIVFIDEASMLGKELFRYISNSLRGHTKVVFIGDPAQLPPVGEKDQSPAFDMVQRRSQLTEVVRQAQDNPIIALSMEIRSCIEKEEVVTPQIIGSVLPNPKESPKACIAYGGKDTITQWALFELRSGRDCRIIAFTNQTVKRYNAEIHECLFGISECPFSVGEHVIVHEQTEALSVFGRATLHTSEELEILEIEKANHPHWGEIEAYQATLKRDSGQEVKVFFAADQDRLQSLISENFKTWGEYKQQAKTKKLRNEADWPLMDEKAKQYSGRAWGMRKAFANLRHIYAITTHKSQGSTFDTAIVDFNDLKKIRSTFDFNRALYVAITRPRNYLAIVL